MATDNVSATEIPVNKSERGNGIIKMWDVIGRRGHYVIQLTERGWAGYQLETFDGPGESDLNPAQVRMIVDWFELS